MAVIVRIPTVLRKLCDGSGEVDVEGADVGEALRSLGERHPALLERITVEGNEVRPFLNVFVNGDDIRFASELRTPVRDGDEISIVPSVAGGR